MTVEQALKLDADFETWAHANQLPPSGEGWRLWLMMAGRGFGKTRAGAEWIYRLAEGKAGTRVALIGATMADARNVMVEGVSGVLSVARRHRRRLRWEPSLSRLSWPNGSIAELFSGDNADGLRGPEHEFAWADELAAPVHLQAIVRPDGILDIRWARRSRSPAWIDGADAPEAQAEAAYELALIGERSRRLITHPSSMLRLGSEALAELGGPITVDVREVGRWGLSSPARTAIDI